MKQFLFAATMFIFFVARAYTDNQIWFIIENQMGSDITYEMNVIANTTQGLQFTNTWFNPKTMIHVEGSDQPHIISVLLKFPIQKETTQLYYPVFFLEYAAVFPTVQTVTIELVKKKKRYTFPIHESTCRYITIKQDFMGDVEIERKEIPLHWYLYYSAAYQWHSFLAGLQNLLHPVDEEENKEEEEV